MDSYLLSGREGFAYHRGMGSRASLRYLLGLYVVAVVLAVGVFGNAFQHPYHLDSGHSIRNNPAIRSLERIPSYFVDPACFSTLRANVDYRPVLLVTFAINHWLGGYDTWWWHLTQILLHAACAVGLVGLGRRVIGQLEPELQAGFAGGPELAGLVLLVHPTSSGVICELANRSSLLTAVWVLLALGCYWVPARREGYAAPAVGAAAFLGLGYLTKVEAVGALAGFYLWDAWQQGGTGSGFLAALRAAASRVTLRRMAPALAVTVAYFAVRHAVMAPFEFSAARKAADMTSGRYLLVQVAVWWRYVKEWFQPFELCADLGEYWIWGRIDEPVVMLSIGAWILVGAFVLARWERRPHEALLAVTALALLSPTSSVLPLAEMANEHRPYLPRAVLSLVWVLAGVRAARRAARGREEVGIALGVGALLAVGALGLATLHRNRVYVTSEAFWKDVLDKVPSSRAHNNYALALQELGRMEEADRHFRLALERAPFWSVPLINVGLGYERARDFAKAREHLERAVRSDTYGFTAAIFLGEYHLRRRDWAAAVDAFLPVRGKSLERFRLEKGLAVAWAALGEGAAALDAFRNLVEIDRDQARLSALEVIDPFFQGPGKEEAGIAFLAGVEVLLPGEWWVPYNQGTLLSRLGKSKEAEERFVLAARRKAGGR